MNYQGILLALFLVAILAGAVKALKRSMLRNTLRLASAVVAFLLIFFLQLGGVFQSAVTNVASALALESLVSDIEVVAPFALALISTVATSILFFVFFLLVLWVLRIVIYFVMRGIAKKSAKEAVVASEAQEEAQPAATDEATPADGAAVVVGAAPAEEATPTEESAQAVTAAEVSESPDEESSESPKAKKKRKPFLYSECAWKRAVSVASGVISGILILSVLLMPVFYLMSVVGAATHAIESSDADDSTVYQVVNVVDEYIASPYEKSFVGGFYNVSGLSDLMCYTAKLGGKIELSDDQKVYADDVLKNLLSHGVSAAAQVTSLKSECATVKEDVNAILSDPAVSHIAADLVRELLADMEKEESEEDGPLDGLVHDFVQHYEDADEATLEADIRALGDVLGVLAEKRVLLQLSGEGVKLVDLLKDEETLGDVVEAVSQLSAFDVVLQDAFTLGAEMLGETLLIPEDDAAVYEHFIEDLLEQMQRSDSTKFDINTIRYYIVNCEKNGGKVSATNGIKGHSQFVAYASHWAKVQSAFAHAYEDTSYGYFTMEINGQWYVYDKNEKTIVLYNEETEDAYRDKISPIAGLINALTMYSKPQKLTKENLYTILNAYAASASDEASLTLARRMLDEEGFVSPAVTVEKMMDATDFTDWTEEEKARDSRLCVHIVAELLSVMEHLESMTDTGNLEDAAHMLDEFVVIGEMMDTMKQTSCINKLPALLLEGLVKHEMFEDYMKPSIAFQINAIAEESKTYEECMKQIATVLQWAIHSLGSEVQ